MICPYCKKEIEENMQICTHCGQILKNSGISIANSFWENQNLNRNREKEAAQEKEQLQKKNLRTKKGKNAFISISILLVVVMAIGSVLYYKIIAPYNTFNKALSYLESGSVVEAYELFISLNGYKDSKERASLIYEQYKSEKIKNIKVGDNIFLGSYEQDNISSNGKEDVEWLVLDINDNKALLLSKYALDCKPFNTVGGNITWETCTLRSWLNDEFVYDTFTTEELEVIQAVNVPADKNPFYKDNKEDYTDAGNDTKDKVFILSVVEANKYFSSDKERQCEPTEYAIAQGVDDNGNAKGYCFWWLRTPGFAQYVTSYVGDTGFLNTGCIAADDDNNGIRPALWINLDVE